MSQRRETGHLGFCWSMVCAKLRSCC